MDSISRNIILVRVFGWQRWLWLAVLLGGAPTYADEGELSVLIPFDVRKDVTLFAAGRDLLDIDSFVSPYSRRDVVEVVLFYQALHLGGYRGKVREMLVPEGNYLKVGSMLRQGRTALVANSVWLDAIKAHEPEVWVTNPLIEDGDFVVGIYARADRAEAIYPKLLAERNGLSAVSSTNWLVDWKQLSRLGFRNLHHRSMWGDMVKMVGDGSADVLLAPFQASLSDGLKLKHHLMPVTGVKLTLPGSRHWVASKKHRLGKVGFAFVQSGLIKLQEQGRIEQAYRESGFRHAETRDWVDLYVPPVVEKIAAPVNVAL